MGQLSSRGLIAHARGKTLSLVTVLTIFSALMCMNGCSRKTGPAPTKVTVIGEAMLTNSPDNAVIVVSVVTQSSQALQAQQENAGKIDAVIKAVKAAAGESAEIKTSAYNLQPQQDYRDNKLPKIIGYETRNTLTVTISDLNKVGAVIDAASVAGANSIERVSFGLKDPSVVKGKALAEATRQAMTKAKSIAEAMGGRVSRLVEEQETAYETGNVDITDAMTTAGLSRQRETPVQAGPIRISSRVQLIVEVEAQP
jgi:uncharacterized protein YggE